MDRMFCSYCYKQIDVFDSTVIVKSNIGTFHEQSKLIHKKCLSEYSNILDPKDDAKYCCHSILKMWRSILITCIFISLCTIMIIGTCLYINNTEDELNTYEGCSDRFYENFYHVKMILIVDAFILVTMCVIAFGHLVYKFIKYRLRVF